MKAQAKIEFLVTTFIFLVFIVFISKFFSDSVSKMIYDLKMERIKTKAENIIEILACEKGIPENWHSGIRHSSISRIGLASDKPYVLLEEKIEALNSNCDLFSQVFDVKSYRLIIIDEDGNILLNCGIKSYVGAHFERAVLVNSTELKKAKLILDIWW